MNDPINPYTGQPFAVCREIDPNEIPVNPYTGEVSALACMANAIAGTPFPENMGDECSRADARKAERDALCIPPEVKAELDAVLHEANDGCGTCGVGYRLPSGRCDHCDCIADPVFADMTSAPSDKRILLFAGGQWEIGQWNVRRNLWTDDMGYALLPTHWEPLPSHP